MTKDKPTSTYAEEIAEKKKKYGKNWKDHISYGPPGKWKSRPKPEAGMRRFNRGGKV